MTSTKSAVWRFWAGVYGLAMEFREGHRGIGHRECVSGLQSHCLEDYYYNADLCSQSCILLMGLCLATPYANPISFYLGSNSTCVSNTKGCAGQKETKHIWCKYTADRMHTNTQIPSHTHPNLDPFVDIPLCVLTYLSTPVFSSCPAYAATSQQLIFKHINKQRRHRQVSVLSLIRKAHPNSLGCLVLAPAQWLSNRKPSYADIEGGARLFFILVYTSPKRATDRRKGLEENKKEVGNLPVYVDSLTGLPMLWIGKSGRSMGRKSLSAFARTG